MKKFTLLVFFASFYCGSLPAQNFPFPSGNVEWVSTAAAPYSIGNCVTYYLWRTYLGGDILIKGNHYKQVLVEKKCRNSQGGSNCPGVGIQPYAANKNPVGAIRSAGDKVYFYKYLDAEAPLEYYFESALLQVPDTTEVLLYDFSLAVGDTVLLPVKTGNPWGYTVVKKELSNGRRKLTLHRYDKLYYNSTVLEGIGGTYGLLGLYNSPAALPAPLPGCFFDNGTKVIDTGNCAYCGVVADSEPETPLSVHVYPNPAHATIRIETGLDNGPFLLRAYDLQGRLLYSDAAFPGNTDLLLGAWSPGGWLQLELQSADARMRWTGRVWHRQL